MAKDITGIFLKGTQVSKLAKSAYLLLRDGKEVSTDDILNDAYPDGYDKNNLKSKLSEAIKELQRAIRKRCSPGSDKEFIIERVLDSDSRKKCYRMIDCEDPLGDEVLAGNWTEYVEFLKATAGIVPEELISYIFGDTDTLDEVERLKKSNKCLIYAGNNFVLEHIDLLQDLYQAIIRQKVVCFRYHPFGRFPYKVILHPHILREYNGRWFVFGYSPNKEGTTLWPNQCAIDRITSQISEIKGQKYEPINSPDYYADLFASRIGVSNPINREYNTIQKVILRTNDVYTHGRLETKKLHNSQQTLEPFDESKGYGRISLHVVVNIELVSQILSQGEGLTVEAPEILQDTIKEKIKKMMGYYE